jgi:hypothetical protein
MKISSFLPSSYHHLGHAFLIFSFLVTIIGSSASFALTPSVTSISTRDQTSTLAIASSLEPGPPLVVLGNQGAPGGQKNLSTASRPLDENFVLYENPSYGFSIQYPSGWIVRDRGVSGGNVFVEFFSPTEAGSDTFFDNFNVGVQNLSDITSLDEYGRSVVSLLQSQPPGPGFELTQQPTSATLGDFPAQKIEYNMVLQNESAPALRTNLHGLQVWTIHGNSVFVFSFVGEQDKFAIYQPLIEHILGTFRIASSNL